MRHLKFCYISILRNLLLTDRYQFLDPSSSHPYHCKKGIPYSQALRLNRICSDNESFDKRCNNLEGWLMERGYNGK